MEKICNSILNCSKRKIPLFKKRGYVIEQCESCGHRFSEIKDAGMHLSQVYSYDYFFQGKGGYPNYLDGKSILYNYGIRYSKIITKHIKAGKVLDVGCAAGFILKGFEQSGWSCQGIEPNETMAMYGRNELNLNIKISSLESFNTNEKFDLISMIQVIGHFFDLNKAMYRTTNLLNQGGLVLVESWDMKSWIARLLGKHWHEYNPPSVIHWFSNKTLVELFKHYGFEIIAKGLPAKKINLKHAISLLKENVPGFIFNNKIVDFLNNKFGKFNISYPPVDLKWYIFKKL